MTKNDVLRRAGQQFEKFYADNTRRLITELVVAGRPDDEIEQLIQVTVEQYEAAREDYLRNVASSCDAALAYFADEPPRTQ
jgi:hypothetical protein